LKLAFGVEDVLEKVERSKLDEKYFEILYLVNIFSLP
jgi:hypothetical protein